MMKRAVFFDMDGVLIDSETVYMKELLTFFHKYGVACEVQELYPMIGRDENHNEQLFRSIWQKSRDVRDYEACRQEQEVHSSFTYANLLFPEVRDVLQKLKQKGILLALASSSSLQDINQMMTECSLEQYFDCRLSSEQFSNSKPDPAIYMKLCELLSCKPSECLVIEDSESGICAGKRAGICTLARREERYPLNQSAADFIIEDLRGVFDFL